jgi:hypothetical protein
VTPVLAVQSSLERNSANGPTWYTAAYVSDEFTFKGKSMSVVDRLAMAAGHAPATGKFWHQLYTEMSSLQVKLFIGSQMWTKAQILGHAWLTPQGDMELKQSCEQSLNKELPEGGLIDIDGFRYEWDTRELTRQGRAPVDRNAEKG